MSESTDNYTTCNRVCQVDLAPIPQTRTPFMVESDMMTDFTEYVNAELARRRISMRELGRRADYSATQVSDVLNEKVPASAASFAPGDGLIASSSRCTPLFFNAEPASTGVACSPSVASRTAFASTAGGIGSSAM